MSAPAQRLIAFLDRELNVPAGSMIRLGGDWTCAACGLMEFTALNGGLACRACRAPRAGRVIACCSAPVYHGVSGAIYDADHYHEDDVDAVECSACGRAQVCR